MIDDAALPDPGEVPVLDWLDVDLIGVEAMYQRPLDMNRVEGIVRGFSWRSFGALVVVPQQDGRFNVTDGQHRLEAPAKTRVFLSLLSTAQFAPISANHIKAVEMLLTDDEFAPYVTAEALGATVRAEGVTSAAEAKRFAETHKVPYWKGLANVWFQRTKKSRAPTGRAA